MYETPAFEARGDLPEDELTLTEPFGFSMNKSMEPVVTKRLIIRLMAETDLLDFLTYQTHPEVLRYMPVEPLTEERAMRFLARQAVVEIGDEGGYIVFAIYHIGDAKMIGEVGINLLPLAQSKGEIGWSLHPSYIYAILHDEWLAQQSVTLDE